MTIFLDRSIKPYTGDFADLNKYWSDPAYRRAVDAARDEERRAAYARWSEKFDEGRVAELAITRKIKAAMPMERVVSRSWLK